MINIKNKDFHYLVDVHSETSYDCESNGCHDDGICRCSSLEDIYVEQVHTNLIVADVFKGEKDRLLLYCLRRLLSLHQDLHKKESWDINTVGGYYGDEIGTVKLRSDVAEDLEKHINALVSLKSNKARIEYILNYEYQFLLPEIKAVKNWFIDTVPVSNIRPGQTEHMKRVNKDTVAKYHNSYDKDTFVVGIALENQDGTYRLIDGYHRLTSVLNNKKNVKIVIPFKQI